MSLSVNPTTLQRQCPQCGRYLPATTTYFTAYKGGRLRPDKPCRDCIEAYTKRYERERARENSVDRSRRAREWQKTHPEVQKVNTAVQRAKSIGLPADFTSNDWHECLRYWGNRCAVCGNQQGFWSVLALDHWIAISDKREGNPGTVPWNILPLCHATSQANSSGIMRCCNNTKHGRDPIEWLIDTVGRWKASRKLKEINVYFQWIRAMRNLSEMPDYVLTASSKPMIVQSGVMQLGLL